MITAAPSVRTVVGRNPYNRRLAQRDVRVICKCWWAGVRCDAPVAAGREVARGDQTIGMAASQAAARQRASIARRRVRARRCPDLGNIRGGVLQAPAPGQRPRSAAAYPVSPPSP
ncbi:hypothetical protein ABZY36_38370 [Streptomyces sp. NPDC006627]|uniref:phosphotransferase-like protein n=1 Tax=Streptomyces sp. NPDC006627 TaxID=3154679 RepID=UPI00339F02FE